MEKIKVGIIGLGNMGKGIAKNYVRAKMPLAVWDISPAALEPFRKLKTVEVAEPAKMAGMCAIIFFVVPSSAEIEVVLKGKHGVLANARPDLVLYDLTTSHPSGTGKLARMAAGQGIPYLDAGMSGGAAGAQAGTLTLMIGGDEDAFNRTRKYLEPFVDRTFYLGKSGTGHTLKLIHNMVCHTIFLATCEGGQMAERAGIKLEDMIEIFNVSNARSYASQVRFPMHILSKKWDCQSRIYNLHKDLGMAVCLAKELGADVSLGERTLTFLKTAVDQGLMEEDFSLLYRDFETMRQDSPKPKASQGRKTSTRKAN
jgi:3-hydroxyisobutyrate dehydrogenase